MQLMARLWGYSLLIVLAVPKKNNNKIKINLQIKKVLAVLSVRHELGGESLRDESYTQNFWFCTHAWNKK